MGPFFELVCRFRQEGPLAWPNEAVFFSRDKILGMILRRRKRGARNEILKSVEREPDKNFKKKFKKNLTPF